jgi:flagellar hook-associated protein FlgK
MIDMIASQRAYQAAAKLISTINEMFGTILNMGGN